jgi:hypothetical protein
MAQNKDAADKLYKILSDEGILVKVKSINKDEKWLENNHNNYYEISVLETEITEAHAIIIENGF